MSFLIPYSVFFFSVVFNQLEKSFFGWVWPEGQCVLCLLWKPLRVFLWHLCLNITNNTVFFLFVFVLFVVFAVIVFIPLTFLLLWSSHCRVGMLNGDSAHYANNAHLALWPRARPSDVFIQTLHRSALGFTARTKDALDSSLDSVLKCRVCACVCVWHTVPSAHTLDVVQIHEWSVAASSDRTVAYHGAGFTHVDFEGWTDSVSWLYLTRLKGHFTQIRENLSSSFPLTPKNLERKSANNEYILFYFLNFGWCDPVHVHF